MRLHRKSVSAILAAIVIGVALPSSAFAYPGASLARHAHIQIQQARTIALTARPGRIVTEELERERGGSGLRYSFDIRSGYVVYEVGVDANTGAVLENSREGAHPD